MHWCGLPFVTGRAIDNKETKSHHQIIGVTKHTLHFTTFYKPTDSIVSFSMSDQLIQEMPAETPGHLHDCRRLQKTYSNFLKGIRPYGVKQGFEPNKLAEALTFDIAMDTMAVSVRPTLALMVDKITYGDADSLVNRKARPDRELQACYNFHKEHFSRQKEDKASFSLILGDLTDFIRQEALKAAYQENIDGIFCSLKGPSNMLYYESLADLQNRTSADAAFPDMSLMPITASRKANDYFNIITMAEYGRTGVKPFDPQVAVAMVNYNRHVSKWQKMGFIAA